MDPFATCKRTAKNVFIALLTAWSDTLYNCLQQKWLYFPHFFYFNLKWLHINNKPIPRSAPGALKVKWLYWHSKISYKNDSLLWLCWQLLIKIRTVLKIKCYYAAFFVCMTLSFILQPLAWTVWWRLKIIRCF